jgi:lipopolysaccharide biosynthesis regulator YciM
VRVSALVSLVNLGGGPFAPNDQARFRRVSAEFAVQAALHEDDAVTQTELGLVHLLNDELALAAEALETSLSLEPDSMRATFLLGLVRLGQRRTDDARRLFEKVPRSDPSYGAAQVRLKRLAVPGR